MVYLGSKAKIAKHIVPILQNEINKHNAVFYDAFVGGANIIQHIDAKEKIGIDIHKYLIALLQYLSKNDIKIETFSEQEYIRVRQAKEKYPDWYVGLVGFCGGYGGKFFSGFARSKDSKGFKRDMPKERLSNLKKQQPFLKGCEFINASYETIPYEQPRSVIYCDIPYLGTTGYNQSFDYDKFYSWCKTMSSRHSVFVSEFYLPFGEVVWEKSRKVLLDCNKTERTKTEKLYKIA